MIIYTYTYTSHQININIEHVPFMDMPLFQRLNCPSISPHRSPPSKTTISIKLSSRMPGILGESAPYRC